MDSQGCFHVRDHVSSNDSTVSFCINFIPLFINNMILYSYCSREDLVDSLVI